MAKKVSIHISESLNPMEWETLRAFCYRAKRLFSTKLIADKNTEIKSKVIWDIDKGIFFGAALPPEEQVAEFLMTFRFFCLKKEDTYFPKLLKIIGRHTEQGDAREAIRYFRKKWNNSLFNNAMQIRINEKQVTTSMLLDIWFNAHYFHSDKCKEKELDLLKDLLTEDFSKYMLLDASYEASKIIIKLYDAIVGIVHEHFNPQATVE